MTADSFWQLIELTWNASDVKATSIQPESIKDMQRWTQEECRHERRWRAQEFGEAETLLPPPFASSLPSPSSLSLPFLCKKTPSDFEQKPDLSSLVCMLHWDVSCSLSGSLFFYLIPKHNFRLLHVLSVSTFHLPRFCSNSQWGYQLIIRQAVLQSATS